MRSVAVSLVVLLEACRSTPASEASGAAVEVPEGHSQPNAAPAATAGGLGSSGGAGNVGPGSAGAGSTAAGGTGATAPGVYRFEELATLGLNATRLDTGETLLCGGQCVCMKPLDCSDGSCISYSENIAAFRAALKAPGPGRTVSCRRAETGRCGEFRYFDFEGDLHRRELRWFNETGAMVAQRNVADYDAYCEGQAQTLFVGSVPRCEVLNDRERICGQGERPALTALQDLRRFTTAPTQPR